ncbi:hypothetical protein F4860DRAFT_35897 [Xylaria cubensis]|nr:hypothetical protein F4860DRAFT_35897 [Xylaria cubensis]
MRPLARLALSISTLFNSNTALYSTLFERVETWACKREKRGGGPERDLSLSNNGAPRPDSVPVCSILAYNAGLHDPTYHSTNCCPRLGTLAPRSFPAGWLMADPPLPPFFSLFARGFDPKLCHPIFFG